MNSVEVGDTRLIQKDGKLVSDSMARLSLNV
jgi:hypothetical protein